MFSLPFNYRDNISLAGVPLSINGTSSYAVYIFRAGNGYVEVDGDVFARTNFNWCVPSYPIFGDNYEVAFVDDDPNPPTSGWVSLFTNTFATTNQSFSPNSGPYGGIIYMYVRRINSGLIIASAELSWNIETGA